jgi:two-component system phosphate regulon sensor histidine kinase PhoR
VTDALLFVDADDIVIGASPAAKEWFGIPSGSRPSLMAAVRSEEIVDAVAAARRGDSSPRTIRWRHRALRAHAVQVPQGGVVLAVRDESRLERLARARRDLVANVSHDLRTPITAMGLMIEALANGGLDDPKLARDLVSRLGEQIGTLNVLARQLVDLEQIESGQAHFQLQPIPLVELTAAAVSSLAPQFEERNVHLSIDVDPELCVLADRPHAMRVFTNLLDNALRFSPDSGRVEVSAAAADEPDRVEVTVADEGPGMAPDDLERVFERFYRADPSRSGKGTGLGLAIARHVVNGHGGSIRAERAPSGGTLVRFTLPVAD